ncbi:MAG: GH25 family lysozyme [Saprospiraceae bacterium]|nr:glycoside hydrolase family 25 protein [Saprospiraceae bacterium]MDW8228528.1 GH25 family lysozyme [Saprospiraceae bacterium]
MRLLAVLFLLLYPVWGGRYSGKLDIPEALLLGIDISHHQQRIDWQRLVQSGELHFVFVKATEGGDFQDSLFAENWAWLREMGIRRGAYHYFRPNRSGVLQAEHYLRTVELQPGDLAPVLDIETTDSRHPDIVRREAFAWLQKVEAALGVRPIIYTNLHFYERHLAGYFDEYPLWIARYSEEHPNLNTRSWHFWQFSEKGQLPGISRPVDLNVFRGTPRMLDRLCWYPQEGLPAARASLEASP